MPVDSSLIIKNLKKKELEKLRTDIDSARIDIKKLCLERLELQTKIKRLKNLFS